MEGKSHEALSEENHELAACLDDGGINDVATGVCDERKQNK